MALYGGNAFGAVRTRNRYPPLNTATLLSAGNLPASTLSGPFDAGSVNHFIETDCGGGQQSLAIRYVDTSNSIFLALGTGTGNTQYTLTRKSSGTNVPYGIVTTGVTIQAGDRTRLEVRGYLVRYVILRAGVPIYTSADIDTQSAFPNTPSGLVAKIAEGNSVSNNVTYGAL